MNVELRLGRSPPGNPLPNISEGSLTGSIRTRTGNGSVSDSNQQLYLLFIRLLCVWMGVNGSIRRLMRNEVAQGSIHFRH